MELKAKLNKPYTKEEKLNFIVKENHQKGYEIKETETTLEAWGFDSEEIAKKEKEQKILEYKQKLKEIDEKSSRSIRAKLAGTSTQEDDNYLIELERQAEEWRQKLKELETKINL